MSSVRPDAFRDAGGRGWVAVLCVCLVLLAAAERRAWESELNRPDVLSLSGGDPVKVVTFFAESDTPADPGFTPVELMPLGPVPVSQDSVAARLDLGASHSRAPPR